MTEARDRPAGAARDATSLRLRRPAEADQPRIVGVLDHWFGGRRVWHLGARAWFRHFAGTSWLAEDAGGKTQGVLLGYVSPDGATAIVHLVAVDPNRRRRGVARALLAAFTADAAASGVKRIEAVAYPDDPAAVAFFRAVGFQPDDSPGTQRLYGVPAWPDYEGPGEDRALFVRALDPPD